MADFDQKIIDEIKQQYDQLATIECCRREYDNTPSEGRSEYARDYARILYSSSFRRLQGKMQIMGVESTAFYRNRLTHSLEVSQIARSIARMVAMKCNMKDTMYTEEDLYLLDAAALAHDIGHPAFGHKGERVLDEIARLYKHRFEGNAQNFRVLRKLDRHGLSEEGLDLTHRTLLAINKYIHDEADKIEGKEPQKFMYHDDYMFLNEVRKKCRLDGRTLDVQIIEMADDIAYAVHDLEDGLAQGLFTIDEIAHEITTFDNKKIKKEDQKKAADEFETIIDYVKSNIDKDTTKTTIQGYSHVFRKLLTSKLTDVLVRSVAYEYNEEYKQYEICMDAAHYALCRILTKTTFKAATRKSEIALYELKGEIVIKSLYNIYIQNTIAEEKSNSLLLPPDYRPGIDDSIEKKARCVIDYIAGMMDTYAIAEFERLTGTKFKDIDVTVIPKVLKLK
jgi:dGTPase